MIERNPAGRRGATNIEMELTACIEALGLVTNQHPPVPKSSYRKIVIYADLALISENIYAAENVWPDLILIEDTRGLWQTDVFALLKRHGYTVTARSRQNVALRRGA